MSITFSQIPANYPVPGTYTETSDIRNPDQLSGMPLKVVIVGQTGNKDNANKRFENVQPAQAEQLYGTGSAMALAVKAFLNEQPVLSVDTVAVAEATGAIAATGSISFSGAASASGTGAVLFGGYRIAFTYNKGDDAKAICASLLASAGESDLLARSGVTLALGSDGSSVAVASLDKGEVANSIDIRLSSALSEQIIGVTAIITEMNGGAGLPDITPAILALGDLWYTDVVLLQNDGAAIEAMVQEAHRRAHAMVAKDMRVFVGVRATPGQALALSEQFSTYEELIILALQRPRCSPWVMVASLAGQVSQSLNADPALQLRTLPLNSVAGLGPEGADQFIDSQRAVLLKNGISTVKISNDGTIVLERVITTRVKDPKTGVSTGVWDATIPAVKTRIRYDFDAYIDATYSRFKLADADSPLSAMNSVVTTKILKSSWVARCLLYQLQGWIDGAGTLAGEAVFERNSTDRNRVDSCLPIRIIGNLMILANSMQFME